MSSGLAKPCDSRAMELYSLKSLKISLHPANFDGHRCCGRGDTVLICHKILKDHMYEPLKVNHHPGKFGHHKTAVVKTSFMFVR